MSCNISRRPSRCNEWFFFFKYLIKNYPHFKFSFSQPIINNCLCSTQIRIFHQYVETTSLPTIEHNIIYIAHIQICPPAVQYTIYLANCINNFLDPDFKSFEFVCYIYTPYHSFVEIYTYSINV